MAKSKPNAPSLPGLEDPRIAGLPGDAKAVAEALLEAADGDELEHEEALRRFIEAVFNNPQLVREGAAFLTRAYEGREAWLSKRVGTPELVQEMATGQALLTCVAAGEWVARRDFTRLLRLAEGMLAARLHLRSPDCLDLMSAMASSLALVKQPKALALVTHVEDCRREGLQIDEALLAEARHRLLLAEVVGAANQSTRELWDLRLLNPNREWTWTTEQERQALQDLAEWLQPGHPASKDFERVVPSAWWDLLQARHMAELTLEKKSPEPAIAPVEAPAAWTGGMLEAEPRDEVSAEEEDSDPGLRVRLGWFVAGGITGALAVMFLQASSEDAPKSEVPAAIPVQVSAHAAPGEVGRAAIQWCAEEKERLAGELVHVGRLGTVKAAGWKENAGFLTGLTPDLPSQSQMYRKMLVLLHLDPPQDEETRSMVPRLLLRRAADEELVSLWERCLDAGVALGPEIAAAAREALSQPSLTWTLDQRQRLIKLSEANG